MLKNRATIFILLFALAFLVACGGSAAPEETAPIVASESESEPAAAEPTAPPAPTEAPVVPATLPPPVVEENAEVEVVAVEPTEAPAVEAEVVAEPEVVVEEPAADAIVLMTADDFASQSRNPLTGLVIDEPTVLNRRPILCKISNSPPEYVRPQSGLNSADIMFEHYAEGGITRFSALFYGTTPDVVGPVRSARLVDLELPLMYDSALCFSGGSSGQGANRGVYQLVFDTQFAGRVLRTDWPGYFRTGDTTRPFEHTFYNNLTDAWGKLAEIGQNQAPRYVSNMAFNSEVPLETSAPASYVSIAHGDNKGSFVEWNWDADRGKWLRTADGTPVIDAADGQQVAVNNVVIIKAPHVVNRNICETQTETECIAFSTEIQIWGGGFASVFRDGRQINGSWQRNDRNANGMMFTFFDDAGNPLPLQLGNTWIQLVPYEYINTPIEVRQ